MKDFKYSILALVCILFASCMGEDYADIENTGSQKEPVYTNLITIKQLKEKYQSVIKGNGMKLIDEDIQIQAVVTGNDIESNIYGQISVQDETGALLICITAPNLFSTMVEGQEILVDLKGLMIGGYGQMPEVGGVYTNTNPSSSNYGSQSIGRLSRYEWEKHYTLIGTPDASRIEPEEFDINSISNSNYLADNCGKLMKLKNVTLAEADGSATYAPRDGSVTLTANAANRSFKGIGSSSLVLRTSVYAQFAGNIMPQEPVDVVGIFTRYNNTWQILLRSINDIKPAEKEAEAIFSESFSEGQGDFSIVDVFLSDGLEYVWKFDARYGMKATAFVNSQNLESESWLISPSIDMSNVADATLMFDHARRYGDISALHVMYSTEYKDGDRIESSQWKELSLSDDQWPDGSNWDFKTVEIPFKDAAGHNNFHVAFRYTSTSNGSATWEIKNVVIK